MIVWDDEKNSNDFSCRMDITHCNWIVKESDW